MSPRSSASSAGPHGTELALALKRCRTAFVGIGLISAMINVLYLTGSLYMLQVYDRVIPSRSIPTLVGLSLLAGALYVFQGLLDVIRGRVLVRIGSAVDASLSEASFAGIVAGSSTANVGLAPLRDLDQVRGFLSGLGPASLIDLPWLPFYLAICFLFHPWIGWTALGGGAVLIVLTLVSDALLRAPTRALQQLAADRNGLAEASRRNSEVVRALGMAGPLTARWQEVNRRFQAAQRRSADIAGGLGSISKVFRMALQSAILAVGAFLVIDGHATGGIIIAGSILTARALAPIELAISNWKGFVAARYSWRRLGALLNAAPRTRPMSLPAPRDNLSLGGVAVAPPGTQKIVVADVTLTLRAGDAVGIIGPSGSGKSSLARAIVGLWPPALGKIRLDGAAIEQWDADVFGRHIGYLPQEVELFAGTVAENIARFNADAAPEAIIRAARAAGLHEFILRLGQGYDTPIGEAGSVLSAGQRQRLGLARALYGDPFLVVLDEPNSNLDAEGETALTGAIEGVRERGGIVVVVAHRPSALAGVNYALVVVDGRAQSFGLKDEILGRFLKPTGVPTSPLHEAAAAMRGAGAALHGLARAG